MAAIEDQIRGIEEEITKTKYNKATQGHIGRLKAKLAGLRQEVEKRASMSGGVGRSYAVAKSGHATVAMVGLPSVGKSTLLNALTNAESEVGGYEFTTVDVIPGIMDHREAQVQVLDLPGIIGGAAGGRGRGKEVLSVVRNADMVLLILDIYQPEAIDTLLAEVERAGLRLNVKPPDIQIRKTIKGGIRLQHTVAQSELDTDLVREILKEMGIVNADVLLRENATVDRLIDAAAGNRHYLPGIVTVTKVDMQPELLAKAVRRLRGWVVVPVSAHSGDGIDDLKDALLDSLDLIRIYLKPQGQAEADDEPLVIRRGSTISTVCRALHRDFERLFKYSVVTGPSAKFREQRVGLDHVVADGDVVTVITKKGSEQ